MGSNQSSISSSCSNSIIDQSGKHDSKTSSTNINNNNNNITAERLWIVENAKKGVQAIGMTLMSPFVVIACPIIGAYEFGTALEEELLSGSYIVDGTLGFLFGVVASPIAPFFVMWQSMEALFGNRPPPLLPSVEYRDHARETMGLDSDNFYNVAIVGCPGTGKSTLLNGLLGYKDGHADAAPVREASNSSTTAATTTTDAHGNYSNGEKSRGYKHPLLRSLMLWDMPSVNGGSAKRYFHKHFLGAFDALVIVSAERLMATDIKLARRAIDYDVPVFFIRNKADAAIDSKIRKMAISKNASEKSPAEKWASAVARLTEEIDNTYCRTMRNFGFGTETLYIISAWALQDFVIALKDHKPTGDLRLIHEKLLIINLLDAITEHRRKCITVNAEQEHVDPMTLPV